GLELSFDKLEAGDFITMNRTGGSGHTAVFLAYLDNAYLEHASYSDTVVGFKYFSAQGKGSSDAGFAYRWAFFSPNCPRAPAGRKRDCGIIRSASQTMLNTGCMLHPSVWSVHPPTDHERGADIELEPSDLSRYDGITTD